MSRKAKPAPPVYAQPAEPSRFVNETLDFLLRGSQAGSPPAEMRGVHHTPAVDSLTPLVDSPTPTKTLVVDSPTPTKKAVDSPRVKSVDSRKGDRHGKLKPKWSGRFDSEIFRRVSDFCYARKLDKVRFFEIAAVHLLDMVDSRQADMVGAETPHDDLKIYKTHEDIISLYKGLTGNQWKPTDDAQGKAFNDVDRRLVEIGMLQTLLNFRGKRINSFKYFVPEIEQLIDDTREVHSTDEQINAVLRRRRGQWAAKRAASDNG